MIVVTAMPTMMAPCHPGHYTSEFAPVMCSDMSQQVGLPKKIQVAITARSENLAETVQLQKANRQFDM